MKQTTRAKSDNRRNGTTPSSIHDSSTRALSTSDTSPAVDNGKEKARGVRAEWDVLSSSSKHEVEQLVEVLIAVKQGDFSVRLPYRRDGILGRAGELLNDILGLNEHMANEFVRVGKIVAPTNEVARVITAVARGDLSQKMFLEIEGRPVRGEFLRIGTTVNSMVDQLNSFAAEVTRVAKEVGTEGKLGGQADV